MWRLLRGAGSNRRAKIGVLGHYRPITDRRERPRARESNAPFFFFSSILLSKKKKKKKRRVAILFAPVLLWVLWVFTPLTGTRYAKTLPGKVQPYLKEVRVRLGLPKPYPVRFG